jgi:oxygen-independent coproporphyrinogen-3 oxidase
VSPAHARELLDEETRRVERVLLELRLSEGLDLSVLDESGRDAVPDVVDRGLARIEADRMVLTREGRLLADGVVRLLLS